MYGLQAPEIYSLLLKAEDSQEGQLKEEHQGHKKESRCCLQKCWINMILQRWKWKEPKKQQKMKNIQAIWCNKTQNQETGYLIAMIGGHQWGWPWFWESSRERKEVCRVSDVHLVNSYLPIEQVKHIILQRHFFKENFLFLLFWHVCLYVTVWTSMYGHLWSSFWGQSSESWVFCHSPHYVLRQDLPFKTGATYSASWVNGYFPGTHKCCKYRQATAQHKCGWWVLELRPSNLQSKCFTHRTTSQDCLGTFYDGGHHTPPSPSLKYNDF